MRKFFTNDNIIKIGHNVINYDNKVVEKLLGVKVKEDTVIDTLPLSWYLFPKSKRHGLEEWGEFFGVQKPKIDDWSNLDSATYIHRCEEDIKINFKLYNKQIKELSMIYDNNQNDMEGLIKYLLFKMYCIDEQERNPVKINIEKAEELLQKLKIEQDIKVEILKQVMPKVPIKIKRVIKNAIKISENEYYLKSDIMYQHYYDLGYTVQDIVIEKIKGFEEPNPNSTDQKKAWLYSLG